jgi:hypothetical protein
VTPTVKIVFNEKTLPKLKGYAKCWVQLKVVHEAPDIIILTGTDHVIGSMLRDVNDYARRHNSSLHVGFKVLGKVSVCPDCSGELGFYYSNPDDNGYFCEKCNKEFPIQYNPQEQEQKQQ